MRLLLIRLSLSRRRQPQRTLSAAVAAAPLLCLWPPAQPEARVTAAEPGWRFVGQLTGLETSAPAQDGALFSGL